MRKSCYDDVEELEDEDGLFCFLVADLCLEILLLMLDISFSLPYPLLGLPVKEILAKEELGLSPCSVSWLILTFLHCLSWTYVHVSEIQKRSCGLEFRVFIRGL